MDAEQMDALVTRLENKLRAGWRGAMRELKQANTLGELEAAIASSDISELIVGIEEAVDAFAIDVAAGYVHAGQRAARDIDAEVEGRFRFDLMDEDAVAWMKEQAHEIAASLVEEQQAVARQVVMSGTRRGLSPRAIAEEVQSSIGLSVGQVDQVEVYRGVLERGEYARARSYQLADGRYDQALVRAADNGTFFAPERVEAMVDRYRDNWVTYRADGIALETAQDATHAGVMDAYEQAVDANVLERSAITQSWVTMDDRKVRPSHRAMHGQSQTLGDPFMSGNGVELMYPGDPDAPADETAGCRCKVVTAIAGMSKRLALAA